jgi:hypothetical protein
MMGWLPRTLFFGRRGRLHLDNLRDVDETLRTGKIDAGDLALLGAQRRQRVHGPLLWVLLGVATAAIVVAWLL